MSSRAKPIGIASWLGADDGFLRSFRAAPSISRADGEDGEPSTQSKHVPGPHVRGSPRSTGTGPRARVAARPRCSCSLPLSSPSCSRRLQSRGSLRRRMRLREPRNPAPAPPPSVPLSRPRRCKGTTLRRAAPLPSPDTAAARDRPLRKRSACWWKSAAQAHGLPFEFFARLIWQESRFQPNAVGPMTRRGQRAEGIAQFMPGTASERGLCRSVRPGVGAAEIGGVWKSCTRPSAIRARRRGLQCGAPPVRDWLEGRGGLPAETRNYVIEDHRPQRRGMGRGEPQWRRRQGPVPAPPAAN